MRIKYAVSELPYPKKHKAILSALHADIVDYALTHNDGTKAFHRRIVNCMNAVSYYIIVGDSAPESVIDDAGELIEIQEVDNDIAKNAIGDMFISVSAVDWTGVNIIEKPADPAQEPESKPVKKNIEVFSSGLNQPNLSETPTPAAHLYLLSPKVPRFDLTQDPWYRTVIDGRVCEIYKSLPLSPKRQVDITITTNVDMMSGVDLISLFPNRIVHTRADVMYQPLDKVKLDPDLGLLIPIKGFTERQIRDNIIKYPHIFRLKRVVDSQFESFYRQIEIDGELKPIEEVIDTLPEFQILPKNDEFVKEYVVRRYLLERDIKGIKHNYPLFGTLDPFLTLFMPTGDYTKYGYSNLLDLARSCVKSRVSYLQSRNPFVRSEFTPGTCIFSHRCMQESCDGACPIHGETSYLIERNKIPFSPVVYGASDKQLETAFKLIRCNPRLVVYESTKTIDASHIISYCAVCEYWRGNAFHCAVYHLDYSKFIEDTKKSWGLKEIPDDLEYQQIWTASAKVLIISNLDFINFKDYEAQTLLNLIHTRSSNGLKTIIISPSVASLVGQGAFYKRMQEIFREAVIR